VASLAEHRKSQRRGRDTPPLPHLQQQAAAQLSHPVMLSLFLLTMTQPYYLLLGPLVMGPYRVLLLLFSLPLIFGWIRGKYGGFIAADWLLLGFMVWMPICLVVNGLGVSATLQYVFSQFFDIFVAYLLGRAAVRSKKDMYFFVKFLLGVFLFLLPFAFLESTQGKMLIQNTFRPLPSTLTFKPTTLNYGERMGLRRAMTAFPHPILYGVTASMAVSLGVVGLKYYKGGMSTGLRLLWSAGAIGGSFLSVSSGALLATGLQFALVGWDRVLVMVAARWKILATMFTIGYVFVDIVAARPPLIVLARYVALSPTTAWNRYLIWQFGSAEVGRHPIFGMGMFVEWIRQHWMPVSIDNHWLLTAMRYGLPGIGLLLGAYFFICYRLFRQNFSNDPELGAMRNAFVFTLVAVFVALGTVTAWSVTQSLVFVILGASVWLFNESAASAEPVATTPKPGRRGQRIRKEDSVTPPPPDAATEPHDRRRYTRFPEKR
jgi:hypothetical protein